MIVEVLLQGRGAGRTVYVDGRPVTALAELLAMYREDHHAMRRGEPQALKNLVLTTLAIDAYLDECDAATAARVWAALDGLDALPEGRE